MIAASSTLAIGLRLAAFLDRPGARDSVDCPADSDLDGLCVCGDGFEHGEDACWVAAVVHMIEALGERDPHILLRAVLGVAWACLHRVTCGCELLDCANSAIRRKQDSDWFAGRTNTAHGANVALALDAAQAYLDGPSPERLGAWLLVLSNVKESPQWLPAPLATKTEGPSVQRRLVAALTLIGRPAVAEALWGAVTDPCHECGGTGKRQRWRPGSDPYGVPCSDCAGLGAVVVRT